MSNMAVPIDSEAAKDAWCWVCKKFRKKEDGLYCGDRKMSSLRIICMSFEEDEELVQKARVSKMLELLNKLVRVQDAAIAVGNAEALNLSNLFEELESSLSDCPVVISNMIAQHPDVVQIIRTVVHGLITHALRQTLGQITIKDGVYVQKEEGDS